MQLFWDLSSNEEEQRVQTAKQLLQEVQVTLKHNTYCVLGKGVFTMSRLY